jgi:hypothetical protein
MGAPGLTRRTIRTLRAARLLSLPLFMMVGGWLPRAAAAPATEILYRDTEPGQLPYTSRILVRGEQLRMDYGKADDDFVLYDRQAGRVYVVSRTGARITEIPARRAKLGPGQAKPVRILSRGGGGEKRVQVLLQDQDRVCAEFKSAPVLPHEAGMLRDLSLALSANHAASWDATPHELRDDCDWVMDVQEAGLEYRYGLPILIHYAGGRIRAYQSQAKVEAGAGAGAELFQLPGDYRRFLVDTDD